MDRRLGSTGMSSYGAMLAMMSLANQNSKLTPEQREELISTREARRLEERRKLFIHKGLCPSCQSKLIRGKKDKKMDYKREWECTSCNESHYI